MPGWIRTIVTNAVVAAALYGVVEGGSWAVIAWYKSSRAASTDKADSNFAPTIQKIVGASDATSTYSDAAIPAGLAAYDSMPGSPYRYQSYVVYQNRAYASRHVNIGQDGRRLNRAAPPAAGAASIRVWVFGSSAVFGATNADNETIPAAIERALAKRFPNRSVEVANFGVVGYTSWQELLLFNFLLSTHAKPQLVVFFTGLNDHSLAWVNKRADCGTLLHTAVGSQQVLSEGWERQAHGGVVIWPTILNGAYSLVPNTLELRRLALKYFALRAARKDIAAWRALYRNDRDKAAELVARCVPVAQDTFIRNMRMAGHLARDHGIAVAYVHQPLLHATKKPLVGTEVSEAKHPDFTTFALTDGELDALTEIPTYRLDQAQLWIKKRYIETYAAQKDRLRKLAADLNARFIDIEPAIDGAGPIAIFSSTAHFTFRGAELVGGVIAEQAGEFAK